MLQQRKTRKKRRVAQGKHHTPPLVPPVISPKELGCTVSMCSKNKGTRDWERGEERCLTEAEPGEGREEGIFLIVWGLGLFCFHLLSTLNSVLKFYVNWQKVKFSNNSLSQDCLPAMHVANRSPGRPQYVILKHVF